MLNDRGIIASPLMALGSLGMTVLIIVIMIVVDVVRKKK